MTGVVSLGGDADWTPAALPHDVARIFLHRTGLSETECLTDDPMRLAARVAQQFQRARDVTPSEYGVRPRPTEAGTAEMYFACRDPYLGGTSLSVAVQTVDRLMRGADGAKQIAAFFDACEAHLERDALDQSARAMIAAAERKNIPWFRMGRLSRHVQLGQGVRQQRLRETMPGTESAIGRELARDKFLALVTLSEIRLPVGRLAKVDSAEATLKAAGMVGYPLVLKPVQGSKGIGVYADLRDEGALRAAAASAFANSRDYMLQSHFPGEDHRLLVVEGKLIAAAQRIPACVTGDGRSDIAALIAAENENPLRGHGFAKLMNTIALDEKSDAVLARQNYDRRSVPAKGAIVRLAATANLSTGGTSIDVTGSVHPDNARAAIRAAKALGLRVAGVDLICPDISKSWRETGGGVCEVNLLVGLRPHWLANPDRDVVTPILETLYPPGDEGRIPTAMITGTMGKTTTTLMLASILQSAGHIAGSATTEGVRIGDEEIASGDFGGGPGASIVLRDPTVTAAALETARGGLLKGGMYLDRCDVAALLNVDVDQIGMDGIETLDDMAALKRKVLDAARKAVVINADDSRCAAMIPDYAPAIRTFAFSRNAASAVLRRHLASSGEGAFIDRIGGEDWIVLALGGERTPFLAAKALPSTLNGLVWQNASNAMAAALLAAGLDVPRDKIKEGLLNYGTAFAPAKMRFRFADDFPVKLMLDFAAHPAAFASAVSTTDKVPAGGKRICAFTLPGDRPDWMFEASAAAVAGHFERFVCYEFDKYRRGRKRGEIAVRLSEALVAAGAASASVFAAHSHEEAAAILARETAPEDFAVIFGAHKEMPLALYRAAFRNAHAPDGP